MNLLKNMSFKHKIMRKILVFMFIHREERWLLQLQVLQENRFKKLTNHTTIKIYWASIKQETRERHGKNKLKHI
jgi:hypothetical protein